MFAFRATERGIRERTAVERNEALQRQRLAYEHDLAEKERIAKIREEAAQRAKAYAQELRQAGFRYRPTVADIERKAIRVFGVSKKDLHGNRRYREIVFARQFVMYWAVRLTPLSLPQIGRLMGDRDHTTVLHGSDSYPEKRAAMGRHLRRVR
jgi:chromosomal replication initiation ATPase DnaA